MPELAMTRTAIRHTLSALAALALLSAFAISPASAQYLDATTNRFNENKAANAPENPKGLATKKVPQEPSMKRQFTRMIVKKLDKVRE
jgi:hypothetical protein